MAELQQRLNAQPGVSPLLIIENLKPLIPSKCYESAEVAFSLLLLGINLTACRSANGIPKEHALKKVSLSSSESASAVSHYLKSENEDQDLTWLKQESVIPARRRKWLFSKRAAGHSWCVLEWCERIYLGFGGGGPKNLKYKLCSGKFMVQAYSPMTVDFTWWG